MTYGIVYISTIKQVPPLPDIPMVAGSQGKCHAAANACRELEILLVGIHQEAGGAAFAR